MCLKLFEHGAMASLFFATIAGAMERYLRSCFVSPKLKD